jgi:thiamine pyrophosphokinase
MKVLLVTGGSLDVELLKRVYQEYKPDRVIGADKGLAGLKQAGIIPSLAVGDFDSLDAESAAECMTRHEVLKLQPEKDFTDTQAALEQALLLSPDSVVILGATGTRMDHTLANLSVLKIACDRNVPAYIVDNHNVIRLVKDEFCLKKSESYGDYLSVIPLGDQVTGLTMEGFCYETKGICLTQGDSLGVSNEIVAETARISMDGGYLLVFETRD